jgi:tellurite methyltransferase
VSLADREKWDRKYAEAPAARPAVNPWLAACEAEIHDVAFARSGSAPRALDVACGLGVESAWLAERGWDVTGVDISEAGLDRARSLAPTVDWRCVDLDEGWPGPERFDLIVICRFLDRAMLPRLVSARLAPGGWLVHTTFVRSASADRSGGHGMNPRFLLEPGEHSRLFPELEIVRAVESPHVALPAGEPMAGLLARKTEP